MNLENKKFFTLQSIKLGLETIVDGPAKNDEMLQKKVFQYYEK